MKKPAESLLNILTQSPEATAVYDSPDLHIAFVNQAMLDIWGREDNIIGQTFGTVFPDFTEQGFTDLLLQVWHTGKTHRANDYPADITVQGYTETRYFDFEYKAVLDEDGHTVAILHTANDVSSRISAWHIVEEQDALISFNNELEVLTHTLSHDLKNPMAIIKMSAQFMRSKDPLATFDKNKWCETVLNAVGSMENIINHTIQLNQARLYGVNKSTVLLEDLVRSVCKEAQVLHHSPHCFFDIGTLLPLQVEKSVLYQVFLNVIGNAVKYSAHCEKPQIEINSFTNGMNTTYAVKDNGIGIPKEDLPNVFHLFSRGSNTENHMGTGIGLCVVKRIMQRLGGDVLIESQVGHGTTVTLVFNNLKPDKNTNIPPKKLSK
ncbi:sensor histidine kinase [Sphingobacterium suaedae]|uniref:histidine kinase n=1 Tax=Sphingobacterium suaedae TaxID=1686402 RepID=A0ABW5KKS1_9SPHI